MFPFTIIVAIRAANHMSQCREKNRVTIEETFAKLVDLANSLSTEQRRAAEEGLSEDELALSTF